MKHPASQHLFSYWNALRSGRAAPERSDIDPAAIRGILADTIILEVETPASGDTIRYPVRLSGTRVNALFGRDLKGECLTAMWRGRDRADLAGLMGAVLDDTRPAVAGAVAMPVGKAEVHLELLLLPLRHKGKTHARLLAALSPATIPPWLGTHDAGQLTLNSQRMIAPDVVTSRVVSLLRSDRVAPGTRRANFVIYDGGRA